MTVQGGFPFVLLMFLRGCPTTRTAFIWACGERPRSCLHDREAFTAFCARHTRHPPSPKDSAIRFIEYAARMASLSGVGMRVAEWMKKTMGAE